MNRMLHANHNRLVVVLIFAFLATICRCEYDSYGYENGCPFTCVAVFGESPCNNFNVYSDDMTVEGNGTCAEIDFDEVTVSFSVTNCSHGSAFETTTCVAGTAIPGIQDIPINTCECLSLYGLSGCVAVVCPDPRLVANGTIAARNQTHLIPPSFYELLPYLRPQSTHTNTPTAEFTSQRHHKHVATRTQTPRAAWSNKSTTPSKSTSKVTVAVACSVAAVVCAALCAAIVFFVRLQRRRRRFHSEAMSEGYDSRVGTKNKQQRSNSTQLLHVFGRNSISADNDDSTLTGDDTTATKARSAEPGQQIVDPSTGHTFRLGKQVIGTGARGIVYLGMDDVGTRVAIKVTLETGTSREIDVMRRTNHPNIVQYFGCCDTPYGRHIVMEYMAAGSLEQIREKFGNLELEQVQRYTLHCLRALAYLHSLGILHRDIKPHNILLTVDGIAKLSDFGVARNIDAVTTAANFAGTPAYLSPEVARGEPATAHSDVWALGAAMLQMLGYEFIDFGMSDLQIIGYLGTMNVSPIERFPDLTLSARAFFARCLTTDASSRSSAAELLFDEFVSDELKSSLNTAAS